MNRPPLWPSPVNASAGNSDLHAPEILGGRGGCEGGNDNGEGHAKT